MIASRSSTRTVSATALGALALCGPAPAAGEAASEAPTAEAALSAEPRSGPELAPVVSSLDFEGAAYLSLTFAELAVPDSGSLNPVGGSAYATIRYVPRTFPFHAYFQTGGGLFATGTTIGPSGTEYNNVLSALLFSPGIGFDHRAWRLTVGLGPALVFTSRSSGDGGSLSTSLAVSGEIGLAYRFFEKTPWEMSAGVRYQTIPGAKVNALSLGVLVRFGSIAYR